VIASCFYIFFTALPPPYASFLRLPTYASLTDFWEKRMDVVFASCIAFLWGATALLVAGFKRLAGDSGAKA
jgi:hypothetical protein